MATRKELNQLLLWAINDAKFMRALLKSPRAKAHSKGIRLSAAQVRIFEDHEAAVLAFNRLADDAVASLKSRIVTIVGTIP